MGPLASLRGVWSQAYAPDGWQRRLMRFVGFLVVHARTMQTVQQQPHQFEMSAPRFSDFR